jgi:hypothetical protein
VFSYMGESRLFSLSGGVTSLSSARLLAAVSRDGFQRVRRNGNGEKTRRMERRRMTFLWLLSLLYAIFSQA